MSDCAAGAALATLGPVKGLDRREFIARGALLALSAAGLPRLVATAAAAPAAPAVPAAPALAPFRLATYRRLVEALRLAPGRRLAHRDAAAAADAFASAYGAGDEGARAHADAVLDAVAPLLGAGGPAGRYAALRPGPGGGSPSPAEAHRRAIVMAAVALAEGPTDQREPTEGLA
jgi:hypothetical protein